MITEDPSRAGRFEFQILQSNDIHILASKIAVVSRESSYKNKNPVTPEITNSRLCGTLRKLWIKVFGIENCHQNLTLKNEGVIRRSIDVGMRELEDRGSHFFT